MNQILIVDDDPGVCLFMEEVITCMGYAATHAKTLKKGLEKASSGHWDIIFLDVRLPDGNGLEAVPEFRKMPSSPEVVILTGEGSADGAAQAIRSGAWDYIEKPVTANAITLPLKHAMEIRQARKAGSAQGLFKRDKIDGDSPELSECLAEAAKAADSDASVLITGESGTGKELFARAIHGNSPRANGPFVVVDCAALPDSLVESVLFGHEKGAFTGATKSRTGLIREADGGTMFLDELGELSPSNQKRFLRVLQERRVRSVGGGREDAIDFRVIAATHQDIDGMVEKGAFRKDLLFRLRGLTIALPPLRDRQGDAQIIAMRSIEKYCTRFGIAVKGFYPEFIEALARHEWPGNVRELVAAVEAAVIHGKNEPLLHPIHLPVHIRANLAQKAVRPPAPPAPLEETTEDAPGAIPGHSQYMQETEKRYLKKVAAAANGAVQEICRLSGLSRAQVYRLIKKHDITL
ncbi:MAG: sigma-54-dependent Fis family transcriptional regulator [Desulfobacteraceae bacterium]|nr:sigma-54-dependent Fis family transcriptional regulator [Desulfobacteraceae bacterium]